MYANVYVCNANVTRPKHFIFYIIIPNNLQNLPERPKELT